jgi:hypothetical protein
MDFLSVDKALLLLQLVEISMLGATKGIRASYWQVGVSFSLRLVLVLLLILLRVSSFRILFSRVRSASREGREYARYYSSSSAEPSLDCSEYVTSVALDGITLDERNDWNVSPVKPLA